MKIEMNDNGLDAAKYTIIAAGIVITVVTLMWLTYRYNVTAFEQGYSQSAAPGQPVLIWTKENK